MNSTIDEIADQPDADRYDQVVDLIFAICGSDVRGALRALVIANEYLKLELAGARSGAMRGGGALSIAENYQEVLDHELEIGLCSILQDDVRRTELLGETSSGGANTMAQGCVAETGIQIRGSCDGMKLLSPRERTILELIAQGQSNKGIARELSITPETVKSHVKKIFVKLKVDKRFAAAARAAAILRSDDIRTDN
ncbi:MAG: helix-turn-helix transcriptional regulator [Bradyrhizobium sp.]